MEVLVYSLCCATSGLSSSRTVPSPPEETLYPLAVRADAFFNASASSLRLMQVPDSLHKRVLKILVTQGSNPGVLECVWIFLARPGRKSWCDSPAAGKAGMHKGVRNGNIPCRGCHCHPGCKSCPILCDPVGHSRPGAPGLHCLLSWRQVRCTMTSSLTEEPSGG